VNLYVHVPFCARRCSYCDFAIAVRREVPSAHYVDLILREWRSRRREAAWAESPRLETVYFGGGTPSHLAPGELARLLAALQSDRQILPGAEVTLETNPDDVTDERAEQWLAAGINRISLGVQSFNDRVLQWMHRTHDAATVPRSMRVLRSAGFDNISVDLIFALPETLGRNWAGDVEQALNLEPRHVSLYGLTIEEGTPLGRWTSRGEVHAAPDERYADEYLGAHEALRRAGLNHYEVSNAALPGYEAVHNRGYWWRVPFIGLGPSAHSACGDERSWNIREWVAYARALEAGQAATAAVERLEPEQRRLEDIYLGLRTTDGVARSLVGSQADAWVAAGWAAAAPERIVLTPEGWLRLDALAASLT
jgi:oxygen-independent coproporphyrinogen-3 oxidase